MPSTYDGWVDPPIGPSTDPDIPKSSAEIPIATPMEANGGIHTYIYKIYQGGRAKWEEGAHTDLDDAVHLSLKPVPDL